MLHLRARSAFLVALLMAGPVRAESVYLGESPQGNQCFRLTMTMKLRGEMVVVQDSKPTSLKLAAQAEHRFRERVMVVDHKGGLPAKVARIYDDARAAISVDGAASPRTLRSNRRLIVAQRQDDSLLCYCPTGSLTREELDTVSEHFDSLALVGILPGKSVAAGDTWKLNDPTVQALCLFDALVSHDLNGKLVEIKDGSASIAIEGTAKGIELGAQASVKVSATGRFDLKSKRLVHLEWKQTDARDQGPASPAVNAEAILTIEREAIEEPKELADAALAGIPQGFKVAESLTALTARDVKGRFEISFGREWQVTGRTESHVVLRLLERGDFVAQATVTPWHKVEPGKHSEPKEFRESVLAGAGWSPEEVLEEREVPNQLKGRWVYRVVARGQMDGVGVIQTCYLVADPKGDQAIVTFTSKPAQLTRMGARDIALLDGLEMPAK
jgi:hypothetical protein